MILFLFNNKDIFVVFYALIKNKSFFRWFKKKKLYQYLEKTNLYEY
jgi:hypothetical protein